MQKKHEQAGFVLIAQHRQGADLKQKALELCATNNVNYTVTQGGSVPGDTSSGIPRAYLFDWTGKCVAEGNPSEMYSKIDELMAKAPPFVTGGREFKDPAVAKLVAQLKSPKNYGKVLADVEKLLKKGENEEAAYLKERLEAYGNGLLETAESSLTTDPLAAYQAFSEAKRYFKKTEIGDKAKQRLKELKKDKDFQKEIKAAPYLIAIKKGIGLLKSVPGKGIILNSAANKKPAAQIAAALKKLKKKYGETKTFQQAMELAKGVGF